MLKLLYLWFKRAAERDARKAKVKEKKEHSEREALLAAIKVSWMVECKNHKT